MKLSKLLVNIVILSLFAVAQAGWDMYHGNAQRNGYTTAVGPASPKLKWKYTVGGPILASPVIGPDGTIYLGATMDETSPKSVYKIWALKPDGTLKWTFPVGWQDTDRTPNFTVAVSSTGTVYAGGIRAFYALDGNGSLLWKYDTKNIVMQTPVIAPDGTVYVSLDGKLTAFTPGGVVKWEQEIGSPAQSGGPSLSPDANTIYACGAFDNGQSKLYAFNSDGTLKWSVILNQYFWPLAPPAVGNDGTIYIADSYVKAYNPNGTLKWMNTNLYGANGYASITVDPNGNSYYVRAWYVWKFNSSGAVVWQKQIIWNNFLGDAMNAILLDGAGNLFLGLGTGKRWAIPIEKQLWVLKGANGAEVGKYMLPEIAYTSSPALSNDGTLYIGCLDGNLYAFGP